MRSSQFGNSQDVTYSHFGTRSRASRAAGMWPGTHGASMGGAAGAAGPTRPPDYEKGWTRLNEIMKGRKLPQWMPTANPPRYNRSWTGEDFVLADQVIQNTLDEVAMSKADHDVWKQERRRRPRTDQWTPRERHDQGWLDRKSVWDRPCKVGAIASIVLKIKGMKLKVDPVSGWVDRMGAASYVKLAVHRAAQEGDGLRQSIMDVVCSRTTREDQTGTTMTDPGVEKMACTFYIRFPGHMGEIAAGQWVHRLERSEIAHCPVEVSLLFNEGKERMFNHGDQHTGWDISIGGATPSGAELSVNDVKMLTYTPGTSDAERLKEMAVKYSAQRDIGNEIEDFNWTKQLPLMDKTPPATETDWDELKKGQTWIHYQNLKSGMHMCIWKALTSLYTAGQGIIRDGRWCPSNPMYYTLHIPDWSQVDDQKVWRGGAGHMDLLPGEMALTFDKARMLTYFKDGKTVQVQGLLALAVRTYPKFNVRDCSTYHQLGPRNYAQPHEYVELHQAIERLMTKGITALCTFLGQQQGQGMTLPGTGGSQEPQKVSWPSSSSGPATLSPLSSMEPRTVVTQEPYKQINIPDPQTRVQGQSTPLIEELGQEPLIEMDDPWMHWKPDKKAAAAAAKEPIPCGPGDGPLRCPEVNHKKQYKKERRMEHIALLIQEEKRDLNWLFKEVSESPDDMNFSKDVKLAKMDRNRRKQEMLTVMLQDTSKDTTKYYGDNPEAEFDLEFESAWGNVGGGLDHDIRVNDEYKRQSSRLAKALEADQIWKDCPAGPAMTCTDEQTWEQELTWEQVQPEQPPSSRPPPNSPPF